MKIKNWKLKISRGGFTQHHRDGAGFTLIELLIVIAIIGILAAITLAVINPVKQRRKAKEAVAEANLARICQALIACQSSLSSYQADYCDSWDEIGVIKPTQPTGLTQDYHLARSGTTGDWNYVYARVVVEGCYLTCLVYNNFANWCGESPGTVVNDGGSCASRHTLCH